MNRKRSQCQVDHHHFTFTFDKRTYSKRMINYKVKFKKINYIKLRKSRSWRKERENELCNRTILYNSHH